MPRLSPTQQRMMDAVTRDGRCVQPNVGGRESVAALSGWHRTARSLERMGLVRLTRGGSVFTVVPR
mgnify:FL=1